MVYFNGNVFQFHKGTIKTTRRFKIGELLTNFNSIKVQLKQATPRGAFVSHKFQFHKGTIKTLRIVSTFVLRIVISIP